MELIRFILYYYEKNIIYEKQKGLVLVYAH